MDASFCVDCLEEALIGHGKPAIFNTDQGVQFTSQAFTGVLREGVAISMDGRDRALGNIFKGFPFTRIIEHTSALRAREIKPSELRRTASINYENNVNHHCCDWIFYGKSEC